MRFTVVWLAAHVVAAVVTGAFVLPLHLAAWLWLFIVGAVLVDVRMSREHLILGNLGTSLGAVALTGIVVCVLLEAGTSGLAGWLLP